MPIIKSFTKTLMKWQIVYDFLGQKGYSRGVILDGKFSPVIIIFNDASSWYIEKPLYFVNFVEKTAEVLMFKIDLHLLDEDYDLEEPFIFPDE